VCVTSWYKVTENFSPVIENKYFLSVCFASFFDKCPQFAYVYFHADSAKYDVYSKPFISSSPFIFNAQLRLLHFCCGIHNAVLSGLECPDRPDVLFFPTVLLPPPTIFPLLLSLPSSISATPFAAQLAELVSLFLCFVYTLHNRGLTQHFMYNF
jgi:hypothetical protein